MDANETVLIVDDEDNLRRVLSVQLSRSGFETLTASDGIKALKILEKRPDVAVVITDLKMPGMDGVELLKNIRQLNSRLPVIILTAFGTITSAVEAVKSGAFDYMEKPFDKQALSVMVKKAVNHWRCAKLEANPVEDPALSNVQYGMIGASKQMTSIFRLISRISASNSTVLITGESGTGKELIADAVHSLSNRNNKPFIKVNCAAIPENLHESEFFGHEKGAFTGASNAKPGRFELANGGTILLDEVAEIPFSMQAKLLRVLQEGTYERVGGIKTYTSDVRVIASTNRNLIEEIKNGGFREDLFYRLNVLPVNLPPLRERREDIPLLINYFIRKFASGNKYVKVSPVAMEKLTLYAWPGNIRELENVMERSILLLDGDTLTENDLPSEISGIEGSPWLPGTPVEEFDDFSDSGLKEVVKRETNRLEKELITKALTSTGQNVTRAAELLRISRKGLQLKMKELGLREDFD